MPRRVAQTGQSGQAVLLALLVLLLVGFSAALLAQSLASGSDLHRRELIRTRLDLMVDAAFAEALAGLSAAGASPSEDWQEYDLGEIRYSVQSSGSLSQVRAEARFVSRGRAVEAEVLKRPDGLEVLSWKRSTTTGTEDR